MLGFNQIDDGIFSVHHLRDSKGDGIFSTPPVLGFTAFLCICLPEQEGAETEKAVHGPLPH
jgi:hypothetical protein